MPAEIERGELVVLAHPLRGERVNRCGGGGDGASEHDERSRAFLIEHAPARGEGADDAGPDRAYGSEPGVARDDSAEREADRGALVDAILAAREHEVTTDVDIHVRAEVDDGVRIAVARRDAPARVVGRCRGLTRRLRAAAPRAHAARANAAAHAARERRVRRENYKRSKKGVSR